MGNDERCAGVLLSAPSRRTGRVNRLLRKPALKHCPQQRFPQCRPDTRVFSPEQPIFSAAGIFHVGVRANVQHRTVYLLRI